MHFISFGSFHYEPDFPHFWLTCEFSFLALSNFIFLKVIRQAALPPGFCAQWFARSDLEEDGSGKTNKNAGAMLARGFVITSQGNILVVDRREFPNGRVSFNPITFATHRDLRCMLFSAYIISIWRWHSSANFKLMMSISWWMCGYIIIVDCPS